MKNIFNTSSKNNIGSFLNFISMLFIFVLLFSFPISAQKTLLNSEPLTSEEAFKMDFMVSSPSQVIVRWQIKNFYYLYKKKIIFKSEDFLIEDVKLPIPQIKNDPFFGPSEVYYDLVEATLKLRPKNNEKINGNLNLRYQGCWEGGVCYPEENISIKLFGL